MTFLLYGRRTAIIKKFADFQHPCPSCGGTNIHVVVYRDYIHVFFLPVLPIDDKTAKTRCGDCGEPIRIEKLQRQFEKFAKTPFYLYTGLWIVLATLVAVVIGNVITGNSKKEMINHPKVGDVYTIRRNEDGAVNYYFLKVTEIDSNKVIVHPNTLQYSRMVIKLDESDYFVQSEEINYTKEELKLMLEKGEINAVDRDYGNNEGFNRLK